LGKVCYINCRWASEDFQNNKSLEKKWGMESFPPQQHYPINPFKKTTSPAHESRIAQSDAVVDLMVPDSYGMGTVSDR
jgi:hypothetical protein